MGIAISTGLLADLSTNDREGAEWLSRDFEKLNLFLEKASGSQAVSGRIGSGYRAGFDGYHKTATDSHCTCKIAAEEHPHGQNLRRRSDPAPPTPPN